MNFDCPWCGSLMSHNGMILKCYTCGTQKDKEGKTIENPVLVKSRKPKLIQDSDIASTWVVIDNKNNRLLYRGITTTNEIVTNTLSSCGTPRLSTLFSKPWMLTSDFDSISKRYGESPYSKMDMMKDLNVGLRQTELISHNPRYPITLIKGVPFGNPDEVKKVHKKIKKDWKLKKEKNLIKFRKRFKGWRRK